ncbi:MAG: N-acetylglucosaminyl-diphospho-decaprenol L-rhamnosyltransferase [Chlamydiae bacterium]|nr:N-acetylglucosaminyl-diphospho-decaprenol L-rhamnosyltransferase [Chlamydiota bacterium]
MQNAKIGVIVLNWNGKEDTSACIVSLQKSSFPMEIVIVDNGSTDDSVEHFRSVFPSCTLIETHANLGFAGGNNVGIAHCLEKGHDFVLLLNNDTVVAPDFIEAFVEGFKAHPQAGILGSKIYLMEEPKRFDHFGGFWRRGRVDFEYVGYRMIDDGKSWEVPKEIDYVCGASMMVRREVFEKIGQLDERFFLYCEETDFCFRARRNGFAVMTCPKAKVWHKVSASFQGNKSKAAYFQWRNRLLWIERNFRGLERMGYFICLFGIHLPALYLNRILSQVKIGLKILTGRDPSHSREIARRRTAAISGFYDYIARRFGEGTSRKF